MGCSTFYKGRKSHKHWTPNIFITILNFFTNSAIIFFSFQTQLQPIQRHMLTVRHEPRNPKTVNTTMTTTTNCTNKHNTTLHHKVQRYTTHWSNNTVSTGIYCTLPYHLKNTSFLIKTCALTWWRKFNH